MDLVFNCWKANLANYYDWCYLRFYLLINNDKFF